MATGEMWAWIGSIGGGLLGIVGGIIGTYFSIKNTNGPRERGFAIKASAVCLVAAILFVVLMFAIPRPYNALLWIPYAILLPLGIKYWNKSQLEIREKESAEQGAPLRAASGARVNADVHQKI